MNSEINSLIIDCKKIILQEKEEVRNEKKEVLELAKQNIKEITPFLSNLSEKKIIILHKLQDLYHLSNENIYKIFSDKFFAKEELPRLFNTFKEIIEKNWNDYYCPKKEKTFGWSVSKGEIFIRKGLISEGSFVKVSQVIVINTMEEYVNRAPKKGIRNPDTQKIDKFYDAKSFQTINKLKKEEAKTIQHLHSLNIPHIVPIHKASFDSETKYVGPKTTFIVEKFQGDFFSKLEPYVEDFFVNDKKLIGLDIEEFKFYFEKCFDCIRNLHLNNFCHNDLKPENFLIHSNNEIYLCDFDSISKLNEVMINKIFTRDYIPPEFWDDLTQNNSTVGTTKNDAYALGVMYLEFLFGSKQPEEIFFDRQPNKSNQWKNHFYKEDFDEINDIFQTNIEKLEAHTQLRINYMNDNYEMFLGKRFSNIYLLEAFIQDLSKELDLRNTLTKEQKKIALIILKGLLHPDADKRMSVESAYKYHMEFCK